MEEEQEIAGSLVQISCVCSSNFPHYPWDHSCLTFYSDFWPLTLAQLFCVSGVIRQSCTAVKSIPLVGSFSPHPLGVMQFTHCAVFYPMFIRHGTEFHQAHADISTLLKFISTFCANGAQFSGTLNRHVQQRALLSTVIGCFLLCLQLRASALLKEDLQQCES